MILISDIRHAHAGDPVPADVVVLTHADRWIRRKVLAAVHGDRLKVDLPRLLDLRDRDRLIAADGTHYEVIAAAEELAEVTGPDLVRIAWHVGNRHTPCQIEAERLLIQRDHVLEEMLAGLGATVRHVSEPFTPEGGAYGEGRTQGHAHGHDHVHDADAGDDPGAPGYHHDHYG